MVPKGKERDPLCARNLDVSHFLNLHSKTEHDDFCLAYVFTHREECSLLPFV